MIQLEDRHRDRLIRARGDRSQMDVAQVAGCSQAMLSKMESGLTCPGEDLLSRWAAAVGLRAKVELKVTLSRAK